VITRQTKLKLIAFAMLAVVGMAYLGFKYVGLDRVLLGTGYDVAADFKDSGGIFVNAEVTYRGVAVGRVSDMTLTDDGVRVTLTIDPGAKPIPAEARAVVANRSAVGEQYVDLRPDSDKGPFLKDGSVIPQNRTSIPIPVEQLMLDVDQLVGSLDTDNLRTVVDELGKAFAGSGDDLTRLIDNGDLLLTRAEQSLPQTLQLITDGQTVLDTQVASRSAIQDWAQNLRLVSDTLVQMDPDLRELVVNAPDAGAALQDLVNNAGPGLGSLVRNLDILNQVTIPRLDGVEQLLVTYPDVVSGGFSVVRNDGGVMRAHFGFVLNNGDPRACTSGYVSTGQTPSPGAVASVDTTGVQCDVINGVDPNPGDGIDESGSDIRGSQNIGGSGGVGSPGPTGAVTGGANPLSPVIGQLLGGLLSANPIASTIG
jgi:phospholipid/cholesterol/gamma-HCH transport system substrate-binding protein